MTELQKVPRTSEELSEQVRLCLREAKEQGATSAEALVKIENGLSVTARLGKVETLEHHNDHGLSITVYRGKKKGTSSTTGLGAEAVKDAVSAACSIARFTQEDDCAGLADADLMAPSIQDLELDSPWRLTPEDALDVAVECENAACEFEGISNSEGGTVTTSRSTRVYGNTHEFIGGYTSTQHYLSCAVVAGRGDTMQRDYWFTASRNPENLESPASVGKKAAQRTLNRLGARKLSTRTTPVIFEAGVARSLLSHFVSAVSGGALYRKASFLLNQLDKKVFSVPVMISEDPHVKGGFGSSSFDLEGVATCFRTLVEDGILRGYVLNSYAARKLDMKTTGNAGGIHNLALRPGKKTLPELIADMHRGLLITELIGHGVNQVTGDYSRGAMGYWVSDGEIQYPVEEITVSGNLKDMFQKILVVGNDVDRRGNIITPSVLVDAMTVAGD